jgi:general secretion pathway protein I
MVIAFAILAITLTALYGTFESALLRSRQNAHLSEATLLAQSLLARAGSDWPLADGTQVGEWNGYGYELAQQTTSTAAGQPPQTLPTILVTASITWPEVAGKRTIAVSTLKLLPPGAP